MRYFCWFSNTVYSDISVTWEAGDRHNRRFKSCCCRYQSCICCHHGIRFNHFISGVPLQFFNISTFPTIYGRSQSSASGRIFFGSGFLFPLADYYFTSFNEAWINTLAVHTTVGYMLWKCVIFRKLNFGANNCRFCPLCKTYLSKNWWFDFGLK